MDGNYCSEPRVLLASSSDLIGSSVSIEASISVRPKIRILSASVPGHCSQCARSCWGWLHRGHAGDMLVSIVATFAYSLHDGGCGQRILGGKVGLKPQRDATATLVGVASIDWTYSMVPTKSGKSGKSGKFSR